MDDGWAIVAMLRGIRERQRVKLERQAGGLAIQRERFATAMRPFERAGRLHERADRLQDRDVGILAMARRTRRVVQSMFGAMVVHLSRLVFRGRAFPWT